MSMSHRPGSEGDARRSMASSDRTFAFLRRLVCGTAVTSAFFACSSRPPFDQGQALFEPPLEAGAPEPPPVCGIHCSRDLKQVLDGCEGAETVVATCNADQGCGEGKCVDACTAAVLTKGSAGCDFWTLP